MVSALFFLALYTYRSGPQSEKMMKRLSPRSRKMIQRLTRTINRIRMIRYDFRFADSGEKSTNHRKKLVGSN